MNQLEFNIIAQQFIETQSSQVTIKLQKTLVSDAEERSEQVPSGTTLHYIHNRALFNCMVWLCSMDFREQPKEALQEYHDHKDEKHQCVHA